MLKTNAKTVEPLVPAPPVAVVAVLGPSTAMGKTTIADVVGSFFRSAAVAVHTVRIETGVRRLGRSAGGPPDGHVGAHDQTADVITSGIPVRAIKFGASSEVRAEKPLSFRT